jgi:hypothetical protein
MPDPDVLETEEQCEETLLDFNIDTAVHWKEVKIEN